LERHLHHAEVTVNYFNHQLVGLGSNSDLFNAIHSAAEKLEKQALKARTKWRDNKRTPHKATSEVETEHPTEAESEVAAEAESAQAPMVHRVNHHHKRKPITLEEAMLQMDKTRDYIVYRDAVSDKVAILVRRRDGDFDLVEA